MAKSDKIYKEYCKITFCCWTAYKASKDSNISSQEVCTFHSLKNDDYSKLNIDITIPKYYESKCVFELAINAMLGLGKTSSNLIIGPCCKCGLKDTWNSMKDNNWFCYQHCDY